MNKLLTILLIICLIFPAFTFGQELPEDLEDFKNIGQRILDNILGALKEAWEEAVKIWKKVIGWIVNIFESYIFPFFKFVWQKIWNFFLKIINLILENIWQKIKPSSRSSNFYSKNFAVGVRTFTTR